MYRMYTMYPYITPIYIHIVQGIQPLLDAVLLYLPSPINNADTQIANTYYGNSTYKGLYRIMIMLSMLLLMN